MAAGRELTLAQKVGQLFLVGFEGMSVTPDLADWLRRFAWGGLILFGRNVESPAQLHTLVHTLQEVAQAHTASPLVIAVDQEGGRVARLKAPFTAFPSAAALGRLDSGQCASEVGSAIALELRAVGISMNMAPVLDVLTNPVNTVIGDRAYSHDPACVARLGSAFIRGTHAAGVLATGKHFPGHGDTALDSHVDRPVSTRSVSELEANELLPFREAMHAEVDALMTAHVLYPAWDSTYPATLSPRILTEVLRGQLGFQGVIVTDDLGMQAVSEAFPWDEIPLQALRAGADLLLICHNRQRQEQAYLSVLQAVESGVLPELLVERAIARMRELQWRPFRQLQRPITAATQTCIGSVEHRLLAADVAAGRVHGE